MRKSPRLNTAQQGVAIIELAIVLMTMLAMLAGLVVVLRVLLKAQVTHRTVSNMSIYSTEMPFADKDDSNKNQLFDRSLTSMANHELLHAGMTDDSPIVMIACDSTYLCARTDGTAQAFGVFSYNAPSFLSGIVQDWLPGGKFTKRFWTRSLIRVGELDRSTLPGQSCPPNFPTCPGY